MDNFSIRVINEVVSNLVTYQTAAGIIGISRPILYKMISRNQLHPISIEGRNFLLKEEVERVKISRAENARGQAVVTR